MRISYKWLKEYLDIDLSVEKLKDKLTFSGIEVEAVHQSNELLDYIFIAEIKEKRNHPNSDHLSICQVFDGNETVQVVCGAPNCEQGQKIAFARVGTQIGDIVIKRTKLRGEESYGMICSERELGISENHEGILVLDNDAPIGKPLSRYLDIADTVFDVEITPNRADLLGMIGVARDLSAQLDLDMQYPLLKDYNRSDLGKYPVEIVEPELCTRYIANVIEGVTVTESPEWIKQCLIAGGIKPINNIVDITNYVTLEYGHPLHAFDKSFVEGGKIIIRKAHKGEKFPALDHNTYELNGNELVIADSVKPIALAGVIGGLNSHIQNSTVDIVLEAACFNPSQIRRTSSEKKIFTDSSYRFERGCSDKVAETVAQRAVDLILTICGGKLTQTNDIYPNPLDEIIVILRPSRVTKLLTLSLANSELISYLTGLGLELVKEENDALSFKIPSWRKDLTREIDLIEEIIRLHGYNSIESKPEKHEITNKTSFYLRRKVQDFLVSQGFYEVLNLSFSDPAYFDLLSLQEDDYRRAAIEIMNPQGQASSIMRSTLLPGLLKNAVYNYNHGQENIKLFELNKVFFKSEKKLGTEKWVASAILSGNIGPIHWKNKTESVNFFYLKGIVESVLALFPLNKFQIEPCTEPFYQENLAAQIVVGKKVIGTFGKFDKKIADKFEFEKDIYGFEIDFTQCLEYQNKKGIIFTEIPKLQSVSRDISFIISKEHSVQKIVADIIQCNPKLIKEVIPFDEFTGKQIQSGFRSLSLNILIVPETKSLTDDYINGLINNIIDKLKSKYHIEMR
ncbi:MAG TPA: phenylalanine--tRNA ligase subunit beta [Candidatus Cloacimonadota bacterium]|nr:phenylalanine--tRNA ligase subunit beta [Candidatus Cloacimonadota bacterium]